MAQIQALETALEFCGLLRGRRFCTQYSERSDRCYTRQLEVLASIHCFTLRAATSSFVHGMSSSRLICTPGRSWVVSWMNSPCPMYIPVWVILDGVAPKNRRSPGCRSFRSTDITPVQFACRLASR